MSLTSEDEVISPARAEEYMRIALQEARCAADEGEIPIGAVVIGPKGNVIGRGHNRTQALDDVTAHAEMLAITAAAQTMGGKYLDGCTLVVTVEPCTMCAAAAGWAQISHIIYGAPDARRGYNRICALSPFHPRARVQAGVLQDECAAMMKEFFKTKR